MPPPKNTRKCQNPGQVRMTFQSILHVSHRDFLPTSIRTNENVA